jgi:hypothetical protein
MPATRTGPKLRSPSKRAPFEQRDAGEGGTEEGILALEGGTREGGVLLEQSTDERLVALEGRIREVRPTEPCVPEHPVAREVGVPQDAAERSSLSEERVREGDALVGIRVIEGHRPGERRVGEAHGL